MESRINVFSGLAAQGFGLAVHGYAVVAYFTQGQPAVGRARYSSAYNEATYQFINESNLKAFENDPEKYIPQYGGFCAFGAAEGGKFDGDPQLWRIVDGKLYLNLNEEIRSLWQEDIPGHIDIRDHNWPRIADRSTEQLTPASTPQRLS